MNITASSLTNGTLTVIVDNGVQILTARNDHPRWTEIQDAYKSQNNTRLLSLISMKAVIEEYSVGNLSINSTGVTYNGSPLHTVDSDRVMAFLKSNLPYQPIANYIDRKMKNPSARAIKELYSFLEHKNMPITPAGFIIAYKGVQKDLYSKYGNTSTVVIQGTVSKDGKILNRIGDTIEVQRSSCDDDFRNGCSFGLHAGSLAYAKGWGDRVVLVEIDPADVVSVPTDSEYQKLRCCKYKVLGEYTGPMPSTYTTEFTHSDKEVADTVTTDVEPEDSDLESEHVPEYPFEPFKNVNVEQDAAWAKALRNDATDQSPTIEKENAAFQSDDITHRVISLVSDQLGLSKMPITPSTTFIELGADSLDGVELVMALEHEFNIEVPDEEWESLGNSTIYEMVMFIKSKVQIQSKYGDDASYLKGMQDGESDRGQRKLPQFLAGDQEAADSPCHAAFIAGYIAGYATIQF